MPDKADTNSKPQTLTLQQALDLAVEHHTSGDLPRAESIYNQILQSDPNQPQALHLLGVIAFQGGDNERAIELIEKALSIHPDYAEAHSNLGNVLKKLGRIDEAIARYKRALVLKPDYTDAYNNLGAAFLETYKLDDALASFQKAISIKPDFAEAYRHLGLTYEALRKEQDALLNCRKAIELKPDYLEAYNDLGVMYRKMGKVDEAISCLQKAISIEPDSPGIQHRLDSLLGNTTDCAPRRYVEEVFNSYANKFDDHLVNKLKYKMPALLKGALRDLGWGERKYKNAIDLGCGTGLSGFEFRDIVETLVGIDVSENMIDKAKTKNIYDELYVDDIIPRLNVLKTKFDLFISCDVFVYIGDLLPLFNCVRDHSNQNSVFTFSTEHTDEKDFVLRDSARYAHSKDYVLSVASKSGFECELFTESNLRYEKNNWIIGGIYVLNCV